MFLPRMTIAWIFAWHSVEVYMIGKELNLIRKNWWSNPRNSGFPSSQFPYRYGQPVSIAYKATHFHGTVFPSVDLLQSKSKLHKWWVSMNLSDLSPKHTAHIILRYFKFDSNTWFNMILQIYCHCNLSVFSLGALNWVSAIDAHMDIQFPISLDTTGALELYIQNKQII